MNGCQTRVAAILQTPYSRHKPSNWTYFHWLSFFCFQLLEACFLTLWFICASWDYHLQNRRPFLVLRGFSRPYVARDLASWQTNGKSTNNCWCCAQYLPVFYLDVSSLFHQSTQIRMEWKLANLPSFVERQIAIFSPVMIKTVKIRTKAKLETVQVHVCFHAKCQTPCEVRV